jgi:hypothetical protein
MFKKDKITEIYCIADDFFKLFNDQMKKTCCMCKFASFISGVDIVLAVVTTTSNYNYKV